MACNEITIDAPPSTVFRELADPDGFGYWVMGSKRIRGVEGDWPERGSVFHHTVGVGPLQIDDHTEVVDVDPPQHLVLRARARPLGTALVRLLLAEEGAGTRVSMDEQVESGPAGLLPTSVTDTMTRARNTRSLRRLKLLVEGEQHPGELDQGSPRSRAGASGGRPSSTGAVPTLAVAGLCVAVAVLVVGGIRRRRRRRGG